MRLLIFKLPKSSTLEVCILNPPQVLGHRCGPVPFAVTVQNKHIPLAHLEKDNSYRIYWLLLQFHIDYPPLWFRHFVYYLLKSQLPNIKLQMTRLSNGRNAHVIYTGKWRHRWATAADQSASSAVLSRYSAHMTPCTVVRQNRRATANDGIHRTEAMCS